MTTHRPADAPNRPRALMFIAICLVAANMRMTITGVGPLLEQIAADERVSPASLGGLASVPLLAWGLVSPIAHALSQRFGLSRTVTISLVVLALGTAWRSAPGSPLSLWLGTGIIGAALAIGNVLLPAVIRRDFGTRIPLVMGVYTALLGGLGAVSAGIVVPISHLEANGHELGWRIALLATGALIPVALLVWIPANRSASGQDPRASALRRQDAGRPDAAGAARPADADAGRRIWRDPVAWCIAGYQGLQSMSFYMISTWLAPIETSTGTSAVAAGIDVMIYQLIGIAGSLVLPVLYRGALRRSLPALTPLVIGLSFLSVMLLPGPRVPWLLLGGLASGLSLSLSLMFMATRARTQNAASALSGMAQSAGYLIAAIGPPLFGWLHQLSGGWIAPTGLLMAVLLGQFAFGIAVSRDRPVFEPRTGGEPPFRPRAGR